MPATSTEKKLGPGVVYLNVDRNAKLVTIAGIVFKEGESVDLVERLGEAKAEPILKKLAGNRYFKVDGGPDHAKAAEEAAAAPDETQAAAVVAEEARIRREQGDEAADKYVASVDVKTAQVKVAGSKSGGSGGYVPPDKPTLEQPAQRRPVGR